MKRSLLLITTASLLISMAGCRQLNQPEETPADPSHTEGQTTTAVQENAGLTDGTYIEYVYGNNYSMSFGVEVTIKDNQLVNIQVADPGGEYSEYDFSILDSAVEKLIPRILDAQSLSVDSITGATMSSAGIKNAVSLAIEEAGGNASDWYTPINKSSETVILDGYDVAVIGLGASGISAFVSAAESGASVIGIDAAGRVVGTSSLTSGPMAVNPTTDYLQIEDENYPVDEEAFINRWVETTDGKAKQECIELIVKESGETIDWTIDTLGYSYYPLTAFTFPDLPVWCTYNAEEKAPRQMFIDALEKAEGMNDKNSYITELKATELLIDENGMISGVLASYYDGTTYEIHSKSVILCTGGFGGNRELCTKMYGYPIKLHGMYQNDGTMILSAINQLNAATYSMNSAGMCHSGRIPNPMHLDNVEPSHNKVLSAIVNRADILAVNENGSRFTNEGAGMTLAENYCKAGTEYYYVIVDQEYMDDLRENGLDSVYMMINSQDFTNQNWYPFLNGGDYELTADTPIADLDLVIAGAIQSKNLFMAESIEELSDQLNMKDLVDTVSTYNSACAAGVDSEFGKDASLLISIHENSSHYYAIKASAYCYSTNGALDVNANIEVLDTEGRVIPGLYACGTDSMGVLFTEDTGYIDYGGVAHCWCAVSGRIAGQNAAAYALESE